MATNKNSQPSKKQESSASSISNQGFAAIDFDKQREIASKGGKARLGKSLGHIPTAAKIKNRVNIVSSDF